MVNKRILICGTGKKAIEYYQLMKDKLDILGFFQEKTGKKLDVEGVKTYDWTSDIDWNDVRAVVVKDEMFASELYAALHKAGVGKAYLLPDEYLYDMKIDQLLERDTYKIKDLSRPFMSYVEYHLADACNLNCEGCTHFSNLVTDKNIITLKQAKKDIDVLKHVFDIGKIHLLGGEPFLNPYIAEIIEAFRKNFPNSEICICTNGLMIDRIDQDVLKSIKNHNIVIKISMYKPTEKLAERFAKKLTEYGIRYYFGNGTRSFKSCDVIEKFHTSLTINRTHNAGEVANDCYGKWCRYYRDGYLSKCAYPQLIPILEETFDVKFLIGDKDIIDVRKVRNENEAWEIIDLLNAPGEFCRYCTKHEYEYEWSTNSNRNSADINCYLAKD